MMRQRRVMLFLGFVSIALAAGYCPSAARAQEGKDKQDTPKEVTLDLGRGVTMKLKLIPAGKFMMGSPQGEKARLKGEGPRREVTISKPFYMGVYEVTQAQYEKIMGKNPSHFKGAKNPVECVTWEEATEFCKKLSAKTGKTVRLPTEAEWEYACRAGTQTPFNTGETISTDQANYNGNSTYGNGRKGVDRQKTVEVGSFKPNAWGLYDMHGNVWEWCSSLYKTYPYKADDGREDPKGAGPRVLRGGSWLGSPWVCRSAFRGGNLPDYRSSYNGFRVVVSSAGVDW